MTERGEPGDIAAGGSDDTPGVDIAAALFLAGLSLLAILWLIPANTEAGDGGYDVTPAFFPTLAASVVLVLSVVLAVSRLWKARAKSGPISGNGLVILVEIVVWAVYATAGLWAISTIGFLVAAPVLIATAMLAAGNRNPLMILALSVVFPFIVDQAAWLIFTVDLP